MTPIHTHRTPEPPRLTYGMVRDGIVTGILLRTKIVCDVCEQGTCGIEVTGYDLPKEVPWTSTIISLPRSRRFIMDQAMVIFLGIGCGCYAKFHRQVAHIKDSVEEGRDFPQS